MGTDLYPYARLKCTALVAGPTLGDSVGKKMSAEKYPGKYAVNAGRNRGFLYLQSVFQEFADFLFLTSSYLTPMRRSSTVNVLVV